MSSLPYALTDQDYQYTLEKISNQSKFLDKEIYTKSGQIKTYRDVSFSANHSSRYYAELLNKINVFDATNIDNVPIFLTITLDGFFRDLVKGDYRRYTEEKQEQYLSYLPDSLRDGLIATKMDNREPLSIKDCYKVLQYQLRGFLRSNTFQQLKKDGYTYSYLRVAEPHQDGVPHFHVLLYVPEHVVPALHASYASYFPAPQNHKPLSIRSNGRLSSALSSGERETQGFQFDIRTAQGYILKYVLKSFRNITTKQDLDYLQSWYIHHKIPRIITSHTLIPAWVYRKIAIIDPDWYYHHQSLSTWASEKKDEDGVLDRKASFVFEDLFGRKFEYQDGIFRLTNNGYLITEFGEKKQHKKEGKMGKITNEKFVNPRTLCYTLIPVELPDGSIVHISSKDLMIKSPVQNVLSMSLQTLIELYNNFDFDKYNPVYFGNIKNKLIDIGYLDEPKTSLNDYNTDFPFT